MTAPTNQRYTNKVVLVTGGGTGIGAAIAGQMAAEGAAVAICGRRMAVVESKARELNARYASDSPDDLAERVLPIQGDVTTDAMRIINTTLEEFGGLDVLVNNAGFSAGAGFGEINIGEWQQVMSINLDAAFQLVNEALPHLLARRGNVLHISSISAVAGELDDVAYAASKAGLEGFSRKLALELADRGVRSNVIRPGLIRTEAFADMPEDFFDSQIPLIPLRTIGQPKDIAHAAAFLCSDEARFITGAVLTIDGGESAK